MLEQIPSVETGEKKSKKKGCLVAFLVVVGVLVIVFGVGGYIAYRTITGFMNEFTGKYVQAGYIKQGGQSISIAKDLEGDYLYLCQVFELNGDLDGNLALLCQTATINSEVNGDVDAKCQVLKITENGHIRGELKLMCQTAEIRGTVDKQISGKCQSLTVPEKLKDKINVSYQIINYIPKPEIIEDKDSI